MLWWRGQQGPSVRRSRCWGKETMRRVFWGFEAALFGNNRLGRGDHELLIQCDLPKAEVESVSIRIISLSLFELAHVRLTG